MVKNLSDLLIGGGTVSQGGKNVHFVPRFSSSSGYFDDPRIRRARV
jgi:hypothetical protein